MGSMIFRMDQPVASCYEQVYNLPEWLFKSDSTSFCDRAMGKGDRLVMIAKRLKEYSHTKGNILSRIHGFEDNDLYVQNCLHRTPLNGADITVVPYEEITKMKNTFTCEIGNPPYNKLGKFPLYYNFLEQIVENEPQVWSLIVPNGWLIGKRAKTLREKIFTKTGVNSIIFKGPSAFNNEVAQNTIIISGEKGSSDPIKFVRADKTNTYTAYFSKEECIDQLPMVHGSNGKKIWDIAKKYPNKFKMERKVTSWAVAVSDGNGFGGYDETVLLPTEAARKAIMPIHVVFETKVGYNHHTLNSQKDCENAKSWMQSKLFGLMFMWVRTTHRTVGSNLGQLPMVIVDGEYTDDKAYKQLGLTDELISWINNLP